MLSVSTLIRPVAAAVSQFGSSLTPEKPARIDSRYACPYLGHVPYFAPKLTGADKQRIEHLHDED